MPQDRFIRGPRFELTGIRIAGDTVFADMRAHLPVPAEFVELRFDLPDDGRPVGNHALTPTSDEQGRLVLRDDWHAPSTWSAAESYAAIATTDSAPPLPPPEPTERFKPGRVIEIE